MHTFSEKIIVWYNHHKRDLPWRDTKDAYHIWLSEIILQQTRVEQGRSYYEKFVKRFPTVKKLASADTEEVMKLWQGLGYYSRARNLHATARIIADKYKGKFPTDYNQILELKGIGHYTAAAIASFACDLPHAVVDGNVYRVLSRVFGIQTPIDSTEGKKEFFALANQLLNKEKSALHNQAIMEFGAMQCKPVSPNCKVCPLNHMCFALEKEQVAELPVKSKTTKVRNRYFNYIVLKHGGKTAIVKRNEKDIWKSLYDFPLIETKKEWTESQFLASAEWKSFIKKNKYSVTSVSKAYKHVLSHQHIYARFWEIKCIASLKLVAPEIAVIINEKELDKYPIPRLIDLYLSSKGD